MGSVSLWQDDGGVFADAPYPALAGESSVDVAIVGGGITGVAAALWLARAGADVALLEGRRIAAGASGRNGGFLLSGTAESYAVSIERYGRDATRRIYGYNVANRQRATNLVAELESEGWRCGYQQAGSLLISAGEREHAEHQASFALLREDGWEAELVARDDLPALLRDAYYGAIFYPLDGEIQPARFVRGIATLACTAGARLHENSPITGLRRTPDGFELHTDSATLHARTLLLATNAWLPELGTAVGAEWLAQAITPTRGQMLSTATVAERLFDCPCYADDGFQYWRQLADGRLAIGGWRNHSFATEYSSDETPAGEVQSRLESFLHETLRLPDLAIEHRWAGIMAFSSDGLPLIGALPGVEGCYLAGAYTGHGNAYALHAAWVLAEMIAGRSPADADLFDPSRLVASGSTEVAPAATSLP